MSDCRSRFFKIILSSTLEDKKLRIPEKFVKKFGDELCAVATLVVPNGCVWQVGLKKNWRKIWFHDGWHDFVKHHSICVGYFLVFKYAKNSTFDVLIFDMTACEIDYPYNFGGEPKNEEQNSVHGDEMENEESIEILGFETPDKNEMYNSQGSLHRKRHSLKTVGNLSAPSPDQEMDLKIGRTKFQTARHTWEDKPQRDLVDGREELVLLEEMGISITRSYRRVASENRQRAITAAGLFKTKILHSWLSCRQTTDPKYVPVKFAKKYLQTAGKFIKVQDSDGREWPVQTRFTDRGMLYLQNGWIEFLEEMNLVEGDICVFELISKEDFHLKVFNASRE